MTAEGKSVIFMVGRTGDGKSTLGTKLLKRLGDKTSFSFKEGESAYGQTTEPVGVLMNGVVVVDSPGLMDPKGLAIDGENISRIVRKAKELGHLNMLVMVMNAAAPRFDNGMLNALKLVSDSFGKRALNHLVAVYTNRIAYSNSQLEQRTAEVMQMINNRCGTNLSHLTFYAVENHPEKYRPNILETSIPILHMESNKQLDDLIRAAMAQAPYSTKEAIVADYDSVRMVKEAEAETARAKEGEAAAIIQIEKEKQETARANEEKELWRKRAAEAESNSGGFFGALVGLAVGVLSIL